MKSQSKAQLQTSKAARHQGTSPSPPPPPGTSRAPPPPPAPVAASGSAAWSGPRTRPAAAAWSWGRPGENGVGPAGPHTRPGKLSQPRWKDPPFYSWENPLDWAIFNSELFVYQRVTSKWVSLKTELHDITWCIHGIRKPQLLDKPADDWGSYFGFLPPTDGPAFSLERDVSFGFPKSLGIRL